VLSPSPGRRFPSNLFTSLNYFVCTKPLSPRELETYFLLPASFPFYHESVKSAERLRTRPFFLSLEVQDFSRPPSFLPYARTALSPKQIFFFSLFIILSCVVSSLPSWFGGAGAVLRSVAACSLPHRSPSLAAPAPRVHRDARHPFSRSSSFFLRNEGCKLLSPNQQLPPANSLLFLPASLPFFLKLEQSSPQTTVSIASSSLQPSKFAPFFS